MADKNQTPVISITSKLAARHNERVPDGEGSRHGRHKLERMPRLATFRKFAAAIAAAIAAGAVDKDGRVTVDAETLVAAGLGITWLKTQHGWYDDQTCQRCANAAGFRGKLYQSGSEGRHVVLTPVAELATPKAAKAKAPATRLKAMVANVEAACKK
jgi:hypothetical protein